VGTQTSQNNLSNITSSTMVLSQTTGSTGVITTVKSPINDAESDAIKCDAKIDYNSCQFDEFFSHELTKCGIIKSKNDYLRKVIDGNYSGSKKLIEASNLLRESAVLQEVYLHQFVIGNGGPDLESICVLKHGRSLGELRYANSVTGFAEAKISLTKLEIKLVSLEGNLLYKLAILKNSI